MRFAVLAVLTLTSPALALEPKDVFVVSNANVPASREVAEHYLAVRKVPKENHVAIDLPAAEEISRPDYDARLSGPLRAALKDRKDAVKVLLTVYGVPLRVGGKTPTDAEKAAADELAREIEAAKKAGDKSKEAELGRKRHRLTHRESQAAVDSELMLLWWPDYSLTQWVFNPLYWRASKKAPAPVLLTARLDGPTPAIAKRLVDDAVAVEAAGGLTGNAYIDARGIKYEPKPGDAATGYAGYDESFREAAALLKEAGVNTTLDDKDPLFAERSCPDAAIYAGWYSLAKYVPCCTLARGAVAWHLASSEAVTLRDPKSTVWCPNLLRDGAAVTIGPVAEPYTVGFPRPAEFFGFLLTGKYTVVECYARTTLLTSWMTVLVGDPLYNPFGKSPRLKEEDVKPSPRGSGLVK